MKARSRRQKGKRFENLVAQIINNVFEIDNNSNIPEQLKVRRNFSSGSANFEKGDINFGILYEYFNNIIIECKKWKNITSNYSKIRSLYKYYSKQFENYILWLVIADNYEKPKIVIRNNIYDFLNTIKEINQQIINIPKSELIMLDFTIFLRLYKEHIKK